eukprot:scaffold140536_cov20-Tisochrysis_lutea.AAC.6
MALLDSYKVHFIGLRADQPRPSSAYERPAEGNMTADDGKKDGKSVQIQQYNHNDDDVGMVVFTAIPSFPTQHQ